MYRIMIVEDDEGIAQAIEVQATRWNYDVQRVKDFRSVTKLFAEYEPHLVLMDIALPYFNGYHWCEEIRRVSKVPMIFISSAADNMNMVMAMTMGADDFIAKPFEMMVLMAKIQALLRRTYDFAGTVPVLEHRGALLNTGDGTFTLGEKRIALTKNEFGILRILLENKGTIVSRERLMERLWESEHFVDDNTLTVNMGRLRKKLDAAGLHEFISTKFGVGYSVPAEDKEPSS